MALGIWIDLFIWSHLASVGPGLSFINQPVSVNTCVVSHFYKYLGKKPCLVEKYFVEESYVCFWLFSVEVGFEFKLNLPLC